MTKILITGGTGFFGKSILDYHRRHSLGDLTILSRSASAFVEHYPELSAGVRFLDGDVRCFAVGADKYDIVIHAATPARVDIPDEEMRSIILDGTANAIRQAKKCGAKKFMMVSSGGVYGKGFTRPISEEDEPHPYTAYGKAKLEAEKMAVASGLYTLLPRCFAFVGKYLDRNAHFAVGNFIRDALAGKGIVINGDGSPMRSYMYADDLVEWLFSILERGKSGRPYNVGSDQAISILGLAHLVCDTLQSGGQTAFNQVISTVKVLGASVPGAANCYVPVIDRAREELRLNLSTRLDKAIKASAC